MRYLYIFVFRIQLNQFTYEKNYSINISISI